MSVGLVTTHGARLDYQGEEGILPVRPLGMTGLMPTILGFGGGSRYLLIDDEEMTERMIHRAIELGVRYFDTAYSYTKAGKDRESLKRYGRHLTPNYRKQVLIASKTQARDAETAKRQIDACFADLKTDVIDVLHFHAVGKTEDVDQIVGPEGALKVFQDLKASGAIRAIGVTGHSDSKVLVDALERIQPDVIMSPQNPGHATESGRNGVNFTRDVVPYALKHGIGLLGMKVTGQDHLTGKGGLTAPELVRYTMSLPVASAIIGMSSLEVLESCAQIARTLEPMSEQELAATRGKLMASIDPRETLPYFRPGYTDGFSHA